MRNISDFNHSEFRTEEITPDEHYGKPNPETQLTDNDLRLDVSSPELSPVLHFTSNIKECDSIFCDASG